MYGPLGQCIYGLLKHEPLEMLALDTNGPLPFTLGSKWRVLPEREANSRLLSASDVEALGYGLEQVRGKSFDDLVRMTHDEPAYIEANGGRMKYEDFLDEDDPHRADRAADLAETARNTVF
jgi:CubicO group peptidase (beta-lactamase class C family)